MLVLNVKKTRANAYRDLPRIERQQRMLHMRPHDDMRGTKQKTQEHVNNKGVTFEKQFQSQ